MRIEFDASVSAPLELTGPVRAIWRPWYAPPYQDVSVEDMLVSTTPQFMGVIDNPFNRLSRVPGLGSCNYGTTHELLPPLDRAWDALGKWYGY